MFIDAIQEKDQVTVWTRDDEGKLKVKRHPAPYYCYAKSSIGESNTIFGDQVRRYDFSSKTAMNDFIQEAGKVFESDIKPTYKVLSDEYYGKTGKVNFAFYDIETHVKLYLKQGFPMPDNPYGEVNAVSLVKFWEKKAYQFILLEEGIHDKELERMILDQVFLEKEHEEMGYELYLDVFWDEKDLLRAFKELIEDVDILSGWNSEKYDDPYMHVRSKLVMGDFFGERIFSRAAHPAGERTVNDDFGNEYTKYTPVGRACLDYRELYKRFSFGERDSYSLDFIANYELKKNKIPYEGDLGDLYRDEVVKFTQYSLNDTMLLAELEQKLNYMELAITMCRSATIRYDDIYGSIKYLEHAIINYLHHVRDEPLIVPDVNHDLEREKFVGAFVLSPQKGSHKKSSSIDLTSLYPSIIRAINISPETHYLQCAGNDEDFVKVVERRDDIINFTEVRTGEEFSCTAKEMHELLIENDLTISAQGSIFVRKEGIIPEILTIWFAERKAMKKKSKEMYNAGEKAKGDFYDLHQNLRKLNLNSTYGAISHPKCRFYSLDCAASVTTTGQLINKQQAYHANKMVQEMQDDPELRDVVSSGEWRNYQ